MDIPQFATIEQDGWQLESGEARHAEAPETFWIPAREARDSLDVGAGVKLLFDIAVEDDSGSQRGVERMWVIVKRRLPGVYIGVLDSVPASIEHDSDFLARGSEVVFGPEHVIDISQPPRDYIEEHYGSDFFSREDAAKGGDRG
jgi:hypothetical protein